MQVVEDEVAVVEAVELVAAVEVLKSNQTVSSDDTQWIDVPSGKFAADFGLSLPQPDFSGSVHQGGYFAVLSAADGKTQPGLFAEASPTGLIPCFLCRT
jgi:hypothetical protein